MRRRGRLAWAPIPLLLAAIVTLWLADLRGSYESHLLGIALNIVFSALASLFVVYLIARSFLVRGTPGLLLLGCGVVLWGPAGVVATVVAGDDVNVLITIHNSCVWLSALCHLAGVFLSVRPRRALSPAAVWLPAAYAHGAVAVALIALSAHAGWMPTFFVQGQGGTPLRQFVLGSAVAMFGLTALLLAVTSRRPLSPFAYWYALALALIAVGLFGVMLESSVASILGWTGRAAQFLSGVYMVIAAVASVCESRVWQISLEAKLREERDFSTAVLDTPGVLVVVLDPQGRITRFNRACEQLTGYPAADVLGRVFWEFLIPPEEMGGVVETWKSLTTGNFPNRHENHWLARDGTRRPIDWSNTALINDAGQVRHIIAIGIDITERRKAERALRENQALVHGVVDGSPDLIYVKDTDGRVLMANPAACEALGRSLQEVIGRTAHEFHSDDPDVGRAITENDRRIMALEQTQTIEELGLKGRTYLSTKAPYRDAAGKVIGLIGISYDITEHKRAEEALRELNATLESKVAERTAELERRAKQLQKLTLELSQAEDRERKRIAAVLHEDLQQHIVAAKFHLSLLNDRTRRVLPQEAIVDKVDEMLKEVIEKSRSLSHELSPAVLHMNDLGEVLHWLAGRMWAKHGLAVHVIVRGGPTLESEALTMFLFRAAQEMLFNIVKHAGVHEAAIRVRWMERYLCLSVHDRGCGFDPRELKESSGFGLLSIRERVELLGGRMTIKSICGRGSRFHIIVPDGKLIAGPSDVVLSA